MRWPRTIEPVSTNNQITGIIDLTHLGEALVPPPVSSARGPPVDWSDLVQSTGEGMEAQESPADLPMIDIHQR